MKESRVLGKISHLRADKGFGFIVKDSGDRVFFHASAIERIDFADLEVGDPVSFVMTETSKGPRATQVRVEVE